MLRLAVALAIVAAPAGATTCSDYEILIRDEGVRTLVALECINEAEAASLPEHWNAVLETPAGACVMSRTVAGEPAALAFVAYVGEMNAQRKAMNCPPPRVPLR